MALGEAGSWPCCCWEWCCPWGPLLLALPEAKRHAMGGRQRHSTCQHDTTITAAAHVPMLLLRWGCLQPSNPGWRPSQCLGQATYVKTLRCALPNRPTTHSPWVVSRQRTLTPFTHDKGFFVAGLCRFALQVSLVALSITLPQLAASGVDSPLAPQQRALPLSLPGLWPTSRCHVVSLKLQCHAEWPTTKQFMHWHVRVGYCSTKS